MTGPFPLLFQCVFYDIDDLCSFSDFRAWYLLALGLTFSFPLLSERFSVCLSVVYLETMFGRPLQLSYWSRYDIQVVYVPVAHVQLLSHDGQEVEDWLNVEPYLEGDFVKLTNNLKFCNSQGRTLATALTHFTHSVSEGRSRCFSALV